MRVGIAGLGLIGGSLALALRGRYDVVGWSPSAATRAAAGAAGVQLVDSLEHLLPADCVIVASPLAQVVPTLEWLAPRAGRAILLDVGSLKVPVAEFAKRTASATRVVGGHPMAGTTESGFAAADETLFRNRPFLVVPTVRSDEDALAVAGDLARSTGAVVTVISAEAHDEVVAALSAVPLAVAAALARTGHDIVGTAITALAGPGFRDTTRLAATPRELAAGILADNAANVALALARFRMHLDMLQAAVATRDPRAVERALEQLGRSTDQPAV